MKPKIVLSGVNLREFGPLAVFRDALASVAREYSDQFEIVALVHRRDLFDTADVTYLEFPQIVSSWVERLHFEYWTAKRISLRLKPRLWLSMHDMTPNVVADVRAVYCHNPAPFYRARVSQLFLDWKFFLFTLLYRFLYRINIKANDYVIVQQNWLREEFKRIYGVRNVVVAHPTSDSITTELKPASSSAQKPYRFFYPAKPRVFKNPEVCLKAARVLEQRGFTNFELWLTFDARTNRYASQVAKQFSDLKSVRWLGTLSRERVLDLYREADCLLFPSQLETWGMPISEFRGFGKPILAADRPYAHETAAGYELVEFFDPEDAGHLADLMMKAADRQPIFRKAPEAAIEQPFTRNWPELWGLLLRDRQATATVCHEKI